MRGRRLLLLPAFLLPLLVLGAVYAFAAAVLSQPLVMQSEDERLVRWDLTADSMTTLSNSEIMEASGNVTLRRGNEYLRADFARYYMATKWVFLKGNVVVRTGRDEIQAEEAEFDLRSRVGWLKNGRVFMAGPHIFLTGEHIDKHWGDVYSFRNAKVTTCDGDVPAWSITAQEAVVEIDGYARLSRSAFQVKDQPVAYTPFFLFPTKVSRQTGLLQPEFGRSNKKGLHYNVPYFWAINENSDLTVNQHFMEKRGFMHGLQYRAAPAVDSMVWLRADYLHDKKRVLDDHSGPYAGDGLIRDNYDRYWLRGMIDTRLPDPDWRFKADIDYVSDQYYLSEFKGGFGGFQQTRKELADLFRRELRERSLERESGFLLTRDWERGSVALSSTYTQDPTLGNGNRPYSSDETVQRLPQLDAFLHKGRVLPALPLEAEATAQAAYMYRRAGTRGARYEVVPRLSLPVNTRYGSLISTVGLYQTWYDTERPTSKREDDTDGPRQYKDTRSIPEANVAAFTEFARVFSLDPAPLQLTKENVGDSRWTAIRHSVQPRLEFRHRAQKNQERNPRYSADDRLRPRTELVYSLTNVWTTKSESVVLRKNKEGEMEPEVQTGYRDLVRLRLEQAYDFREASRAHDRDEFPRRPYSDIFADLSIQVLDNLSLSTRNDWSPYSGEFTRHQSGISMGVKEYAKVYVGYDLRKALDEYAREREESVNYLTLGLETAKLGPLSLYSSFSYDYRDHSNRELQVDLAYTHQCFKIIGRVTSEPQERNYQLLIMLTGLGD